MGNRNVLFYTKLRLNRRISRCINFYTINSWDDIFIYIDFIIILWQIFATLFISKNNHQASKTNYVSPFLSYLLTFIDKILEMNVLKT